jgi:hypothetical protein
MVGLLILLGLGLFVLGALLYATRCDDNYDVADGVEQHPGYRFVPSRNSGMRLPETTRSPMDTIYTTELDAQRALAHAHRSEHHRADTDDAAD